MLTFVFFSYFPNQIAFDFFMFNLRHASLPKSPTVFKAFSTEIKSAQKRFVSSANWLNLISCPNILIPVILGSCLILLDNISMESPNKYGERPSAIRCHPIFILQRPWTSFRRFFFLFPRVAHARFPFSLPLSSASHPS